MVKEKAGEEARFLQWAELILVKDGRIVASCPVKSKERERDVIFSFGVAPDHLDGSKFTVDYIAHTKEKDKQGREQWVGHPSANLLTFPLKEFAKQGKAN